MASYTWNGSNDAPFDDPMQWTPNGIPGIGDTATILNGQPDLVGLTISATAHPRETSSSPKTTASSSTARSSRPGC